MNGAKLPYQVRSTERFFDRPDVKEFLKGVRTASVIPTEGVYWLDELRTLAQPFLTGAAIDGIAGLLHLARPSCPWSTTNPYRGDLVPAI